MKNIRTTAVRLVVASGVFWGVVGVVLAIIEPKTRNLSRVPSVGYKAVDAEQIPEVSPDLKPETLTLNRWARF